MQDFKVINWLKDIKFHRNPIKLALLFHPLVFKFRNFVLEIDDFSFGIFDLLSHSSDLIDNGFFLSDFVIINFVFFSHLFCDDIIFLLNDFDFLIWLLIFVNFEFFKFHRRHFFHSSKAFTTNFVFHFEIFTFKFRFNLSTHCLKPSIIINFDLSFYFIML